MVNNNGYRRQASFLGLGRHATWREIRVAMGEMAAQLGLPRRVSWGQIRRAQKARERDLYERLRLLIEGGSTTPADDEVIQLVKLVVHDNRWVGDFNTMVAQATAVLMNFLRDWPYLRIGDIPLSLQVYLVFARYTKRGMEEGDLERFREFLATESVVAPFELDPEDDDLPATMRPHLEDDDDYDDDDDEWMDMDPRESRRNRWDYTNPIVYSSPKPTPDMVG